MRERYGWKALSATSAAHTAGPHSPRMASVDPLAKPRPTWRELPRTVVVLGFVSLLMDTSSELIHSLLPVFLVSVLGASAATVGFIEGFAEATAAVGKVFS